MVTSKALNAKARLNQSVSDPDSPVCEVYWARGLTSLWVGPGGSGLWLLRAGAALPLPTGLGTRHAIRGEPSSLGRALGVWMILYPRLFVLRRAGTLKVLPVLTFTIHNTQPTTIKSEKSTIIISKQTSYLPSSYAHTSLW